MKRKEKKNMYVVTTEKQFRKKDFFSRKHRYAIVVRDGEFETEYELSDRDYVITPSGERVKIPGYSTTFVVVFHDDVALVYGDDSPLLYLPKAFHRPAASFEDALKDIENGEILKRARELAEKVDKKDDEESVIAGDGTGNAGTVEEEMGEEISTSGRGVDVQTHSKTDESVDGEETTGENSVSDEKRKEKSIMEFLGR